MAGPMRLLNASRRTTDERLLWSRDIRFVHQLADAAPGSRILDLGSGAVLIGPAEGLTDAVADEVAEYWCDP